MKYEKDQFDVMFDFIINLFILSPFIYLIFIAFIIPIVKAFKG